MSTNLDLVESKTATKGVLIRSHSRAKAFRPEKYGVKDSCTMIRIEDPTSEFKKLVFRDQFSSIAQFKFDDAETDYVPAFGHMQLISEKQAEDIVDFFKIASDSQLLVVHCFAGVCRSSAVAAAYCKYLGDDATHDIIFEAKRYVPNMYVYQMLIAELHKRGVIT